MCVQEEITQGVVSLSVETGKMTADLLQKAVKKVLEEMQKKPSQRILHQGKQTLHQGEARRTTPEKKPSIRERLAEAKRECGERKPPDKVQQKKPPEHDL